MGERTIYLDNAATSFPKPEAVHARLGSFLRDHGANPGRGSYRMVQEAESIVSGARRRLAAFFNAPDPSRVIFAFNATDALNMGLVGALRKGDHVVTTLVDHNSIVRPLNTMERDGLVTVARVRPDGHGVVDPAEVALAFRPGTRMVAMLHGSNVSGALQPIEAIG
jgi:selenocysteine lyase/cysteine desulfurase